MSHDEGDTSKESAQNAGPLVRGISFGGAMLLLALVLLIPTQYLNHTGFCYAEMKYLNEREIIDRLLFKDRAQQRTLEERVRTMKERNGAEYPYCCRAVRPTSSRFDLYDAVHRSLGLYVLQVTIINPNEYYLAHPGRGREPYDARYISVNACGTFAPDEYGEDITQKEYEDLLEANKDHWKGMLE